MVKLSRHTRSTNKITVVTTQPREILRHDISDNELELLCTVESEQMFLLASGGAIAVAPMALSLILEYFCHAATRSAALTTVDHVTVIMFCCFLIVSVALYVARRPSKRRSARLRDQIRSRGID